MNLQNYLTTISENNVTIASNTPKVFKAGQLSVLEQPESLKGSVSGAYIRVDDVSMVEHDLTVKLSSKNLLSTISNWTNGTNIVPLDKPIHMKKGETYTFSFETTYTNYRLMLFGTNPDGTPLELLSGGGAANMNTYIKNMYVATNNRIQSSGNISGNIQKIICNRDLLVTAIQFWNSANESGKTYSNPQLELGTVVTAYTPYTTNFEGVEVSRYGKNLLNGKLRENPETQNRLTIQYLADEDCYLFNGTTTSVAAAYYNVIHAKKLESNNLTLTTQYVSGEYSNPNNEVAVFYVSYRETADSSDVNWVNAKLLVKNHSVSSIYPMPYWGRSWFYIGPNVTFNNYKVKVQVEEGLQATEYEKADFQTATADSEGNVVGLTSLSPTTSLTTDFSGVIITMEYYKDADKAFEEQILNIAMTGGI